MTYQENKNKKLYAVDWDHTITADPKGIYSADPPPCTRMIAKVNEKYMSGHIIIIWTARPWSFAQFLASWLIRHGVMFHGIYCQKGGFDVAIDDKMESIEDFLKGE